MGGFVAIDRRTAGIQLEDESIELRTAQGLRQNLGAAAHINVTSYNRMVLLTGEVASAADRELAERLAKSQENVNSVVNDLVIEPAISITQRSKDIIISGQLKALFVDAKDLQANAFKVVTERGVVYLMGRVTDREAQRATEVARGGNISGIVKVVRVFEIISDDELKRLSAQPLSPQAQPKL
jgi:osmotically-inducible protein OsmY